MKVQVASIAPRALTGAAQQMVEEYVRRTQSYFALETPVFKTEAAFVESLERAKAQTRPVVVLLDSRGKQVSSEELAGMLDRHKLAATRVLVFAVGPADGWSAGVEARVSGLVSGVSLLSLGPMTLPHELARVVLAEQLYRAATILAGHPYHSGH